MGGIFYVTNSINSTFVNPKQQLLVAVPGAKELRVTPTYANQVMPGHQIVMELGSPNYVATAIMSKFRSNIENTLEEEKLLAQLETLGPEVEVLKTSTASRAQPFLRYAREKVSYDIVNKIQGDWELESKDIKNLVSLVYPILRKSAEATSFIKGSIRDYIRSGEADEQTLLWFASNVDPIFEKLVQYNKLNAKLQQINQDSDFSGLEQTLSQAIESIKNGNAKEEIEFGSSKINVYQELQRLISVAPGKQFLCRIDEVVEGENTNGLISPFRCNVSKNNIPEDLKPYYIDVARFGQIITLFDRALSDMLVGYARKNQEIQKLCETCLKYGKDVPPSVLMRAIFPEDHQPILALYSDLRIQIIVKEECTRRIIDIVRKGRAQTPRIVAEYFEIPEEQIKFEELVLLQAQLMQLLPFPVYVCAETNSRISYSIDEAKKHRALLTSKERILLAKYETNDGQLQRDFSVNHKKITSPTESTLEDAIKLFGEEFYFIEKLKLREE